MEERLNHDADKLTKMISGESVDTTRGDVPCRGKKPNLGIFLILYDGENINEAKLLFQRIEKNYPLIKIIWSFPNK